MPDNLILTVEEVVEDSNRLVAAFGNQNEIIVENDIEESVSSGDAVRINEDGTEALELIKAGGVDTGNLVGVVKRISSERVVVQTDNAPLGFANPDDVDLEVDDTVEIASGRILRVIDDIEPLSFDEGAGDSDVSEYRTDNPEKSFSDIGGLDRIKERVREVVELPLSRAEEFSEIGAEAPTGVLFYGPPGTGKTLFAQAVANSLENGTFYNINGPEVLSKWYGESEREIRRIFEDASDQEGPSVIFIDEIESIASSREGSREVNRRIVTQLLTMLDGFDDFEDVIVIAATNRPEDIDQALRRPGRFDREIEFPSELPTRDRVDILKTISEQEDMKISDSVDFEEYGAKAEGWSGAELERLLNDAAIIAIKDGKTTIMSEDLNLAFRQVERSRRNKKKTSKGESND
ncbi:AAA family ATPase [Halovenus sp. WSH3]|uniref:AAA family ATPase n=1 Tax=Halovenus carboxidivorans TaxID=2692199 RepID=A0A6B0T1F0_9EURY|nr:AAA family ATPase [Halovenus carboxidivorans]MXR52038.1 AAA family ATPase [Halovenus carboxidivorans]